MHFSQQNSIENDNRIKQLQKKREAIQKQTEMRRKEIEQYSDLDYEKIQKENEILIQDKYNVEQRAAKLQEVQNALKLSVMKQVGKIQVSAEALCKHKQNIYEHMVRHKSKEADLFLLVTNTKPKDYFQVLEDNLNQGPLVQEKEKEMEALKLQNEILKNELEIQSSHKKLTQKELIQIFSRVILITQTIILQKYLIILILILNSINFQSYLFLNQNNINICLYKYQTFYHTIYYISYILFDKIFVQEQYIKINNNTFENSLIILIQTKISQKTWLMKISLIESTQVNMRKAIVN